MGVAAVKNFVHRDWSELVFKGIGQKLGRAAVAGTCWRKLTAMVFYDLIKSDFFAVKAGELVQVKNIAQGFVGKGGALFF